LTEPKGRQDSAPPLQGTGTVQKVIILIEDDVQARGVLKELLKEVGGYKTIEAENGEDVRLLITDAILPKKSGNAVY
jgi:DNA-binding response OmpR family regulator